MYNGYMRCIVGLGNPGKKYIQNRHNVGFMFVDEVVGDRKWLPTKTDIVLYNWNDDKGERIEYIKPQTFMNESGKAVKYVVKKYDLAPENLFIVHDDLDIRLGEFKIQKGKGPKVHNGVNSIEKVLKTVDFWRIRIGVDNRDPDNRISGERYVLENFLAEEMQILKDVFKKITKDLHISL